MSLVLQALIIICLLAGIGVSVMGMKGNILYKGGFYFLILMFAEKMYLLIVPRIVHR